MRARCRAIPHGWVAGRVESGPLELWALGFCPLLWSLRRGLIAKDGNFPIAEHDWQSQSYVDEWISRGVQRDGVRRPRLREMLSLASLERDSAVAVLDVGGGYGVVSEEILRAFPQARVTLQDYSQPMLDHARRQLSGYGVGSATSLHHATPEGRVHTVPPRPRNAAHNGHRPH
jgi:hypothetical protein